MKKILFLVSYLVLCHDLYGQRKSFFHIEIPEDTSSTFFNHLTCLLDIEYPDSLTLMTREGRHYIEGKIGDRDWVITNSTHLTCQDIPVYPGKEGLFTSIYEVLRQLDSSEINQLANGGSYLLFRYKIEGIFTQWPDSDTISSTWSTYYSNIDTVFLPPCTLDDLKMFFFIRSQLNPGASFVWLDQSTFSDEDLFTLEQMARAFPNSVLSDVSLWYTTNFKYLNRRSCEGLGDADKEGFKQELENIKNNTKSEFLVRYLTR